MSGIKPPLPYVPSQSANRQLYLSFTFICLITIWFSSVDVKIHKLSRDRCIYSWQGILSQRLYGIILWGLSYSFISQHCIKFWSYITTKQKWHGECKGCHDEMLLKNVKCLSEQHMITDQYFNWTSPNLMQGCENLQIQAVWGVMLCQLINSYWHFEAVSSRRLLEH